MKIALKTMVFLASLSVALPFLLSCERDEICIDQTTPKLIIRFYDSENPELFKQVLNLRVSIEGTEEDYVNQTITTLTDSIALPVSVDGGQTRYTLTVLQSVGEEEVDNSDALKIAYSQDDLFVSRPCGYKAVFLDVSYELEVDQDNWIEEIVALGTPLEITDENSAHVKIYH